jgi:hypothetical protein
MSNYDISYFNISIDNSNIVQEYVQSFNTNVPWGLNATYIYKDQETALAPQFNRTNKHLVIENKIESGNIILKTQASGRTIIQDKLDVKEIRFNSTDLKPFIYNVNETIIVKGDLTVSGGFMINSNISGGSIINSTIKTTTANIRDLSVDYIAITGNIEPLSNNTSNFGSLSKTWSKIFVYDLSVSRINGQPYEFGVSGGLTTNSVNSSHIINGSILGTDISSRTITGSNIALSTIELSNLTANAISSLNIAGLTSAISSLQSSLAALTARVVTLESFSGGDIMIIG